MAKVSLGCCWFQAATAWNIDSARDERLPDLRSGLRSLEVVLVDEREDFGLGEDLVGLAITPWGNAFVPLDAIRFS
jgi:hypothetical protein